MASLLYTLFNEKRFFAAVYFRNEADMNYLYFSLQALPSLHSALATSSSASPGQMHYRRFPDGECYLQILSDCHDKDVVILHSFYAPDQDFLALLFLATALKQQGAKRVGLLAPYLAYMRQDIAFNPGELITSQVFAQLISNHFDWLLTVDPHLHRIQALEQIYSIPCVTLHVAPLLHRWIKDHIDRPLLIGPDSESAQWVELAAQTYGMPFLVLNKERLGDREVQISMPSMAQWHEHRPVLIDDIISSGRTLLNSIAQLQEAGFTQCTCVTIHGVFAEDSYEQLKASGADIVSTTSIPHCSNQIDISDTLVTALENFLHDN